MKIKQSQILAGLALCFGLLSLFSIWNSYQWDILGWGTQLFLFPFLAAISFLAKLTPQQRQLYVRIQIGLLVLHTILYLIVFNLQDPHAPNLLLLLVSLLLSTLIFISAKISLITSATNPSKLRLQTNRVKGLLLVSGLFFVAMGSFAQLDLLLPGIVLEVVAIIGYIVLLIKESK
jgi:hypothetical protein